MRTTPTPLFGNQKSVKAPPGNAAHFFTQGRQHRDLMGIVLKFRPDGFCSENDCRGLLMEDARACPQNHFSSGLFRFPRAEEGRGVADGGCAGSGAKRLRIQRR